jgi:THO complex subunit 1
VQKYVQRRQKLESDTPVTENECLNLTQHLLQLKAQSESSTLAAARLDSIFRDRFINIIENADTSDPEFVELWVLIDLITILSDHECCEKGLNFLLIEELLDSQTIDGCRKTFDLLEPRRERMTAKYWPEKKLVILRCCNELLRRLSRAEDTVFCGRVSIYLFQSFPLGERSSVNLRGEFHSDNVTTFDPAVKKSEDAIKPMEIDSEIAHIASRAHTPASTAPESENLSKTGRSTPLPRSSRSEPKSAEVPPDLDALYPKFWSLQALFSAPTRLFDSSSMSRFKESLTLTLSCFKSISTSSSSTQNAPAPTTGQKRKHSAINGNASTAIPFNPKYLTNRDLFDLEIQDLAFRRHVLVQALIMLDFLLSLSTSSKTKYSDLINWVAPPPPIGEEKEKETDEDKARKIQPNKAVLYAFTLSEVDEKWCVDTRKQITSYLQSQGAGNEGKLYSRTVDTVLSRDKNWMRWKAESCPLISRHPVPASTYLSAQTTLVEITERANRPLIQPPGVNDFSFLNQTPSIDSLKHPARRYHTPTIQEYHKQVQMDELDLDFATEEEKKEIQERIAGRVWRALRASVDEGKRMGMCERLYPPKTNGTSADEGWNLNALSGEDEKEQNVDDAAAEKTNGDGPSHETEAVKSHIGTPAADQHNAGEMAVSTPAQDSGAADEEMGDVASPEPQHVASLPAGTEEEATPTPAPVLDAVDGPDAEMTGENNDGSQQGDATATPVDAEDEDGEGSGETNSENVEEVERQLEADVGEGADRDEVMDDFAPGGISDS